MPNFNGQMNRNPLWSTLFNAVEYIRTIKNISVGNRLVDEARISGNLYGDTKLYYTIFKLPVNRWATDPVTGEVTLEALNTEAANLLQPARPKDPAVQAIVLNKFFQSRITLNQILGKLPFTNGADYAGFMASVESTLDDSQRIFDFTEYNATFGTLKAEGVKQNQTVNYSSSDNVAQVVAEKIANVLDEMGDYSEEYTDHKQSTIFDKDSLKIIVSSKWLNKFKYLDLPVIFNNSEIKEKLYKDSLNSKYFGEVINENGTVSAEEGASGEIRVLHDSVITIDGAEKEFVAGTSLPAGVEYKAGEVYREDSEIVCKIVHVLPPYISSVNVTTAFVNPRSHDDTKYLTFGRNTIEYLKGEPFVTIKAHKE